MQTKNHCNLEATIIIKNRCFLLATDYMPNTMLDNHHVRLSGQPYKVDGDEETCGADAEPGVLHRHTLHNVPTTSADRSALRGH